MSQLQTKSHHPITSPPLITQLSNWLSNEPASQRLAAAAASYAYWWQHEFSITHDPSQIHGETNEFRYRSRPWHEFRIQNLESTDVKELLALTTLACQLTGTKLKISSPATVQWSASFQEILNLEWNIESETELIARLANFTGGTLRIVGNYDSQVFSPAAIGNIPIVPSCVLLNGRIELLNYLQEQSISETVHRYGNIV